jgi:F-type H+-transporting ATPase subunit gamma
MSQTLNVLQVLPVDVGQGSDLPAGQADYIYEQPPVEMLDRLMPRYVEVAVLRAMLETVASYQAARMTAMDKASSNAKEVIDSLTLHMNRVRQAAITKEIIEVVSGAAAAAE